ncbi:Crp/Fnr family transcriptional regulator [Paramagnetospirillum magneticum]|uniref:cAMP-binding protein-catabolite gene activator and regulatory subunit of cAMP-dependent protein kinase n=1 Tax=Paramagnetospirillum magneticum (strain ATCC 700264 / AMB-1) TaxID=342108 RepID=Q2W7H4_PARM1|nr:Crp/Fnr family transcriptional regulator [Paramagnetospirillum magneticum]BAE50201.1 cAMP-binding protein - catabolite gene activator and regulatory subunit of cAMP-dependent protein kinase [Paramagnetospirillum magneticum AMB-1]
MQSDTLSVLRRSRLFSAVSAADAAALLEDHRILELADGAVVFAEDSLAEFLFLVLDGEIAIDPCATSPQLRLCAGDTAGEEAVLTGTPHGATARASGPVTLLALPAGTLMAYLETHFEVAIAMISAMAGHLREQVREITELKMQSTAERLASYLLALAGEATGRAVVRLPFEKRHLADHLGMDPATLSRAFAKLRDKGVVASRTDKVEIADVAELRIYGDCAAFTA